MFYIVDDIDGDIEDGIADTEADEDMDSMTDVTFYGDSDGDVDSVNEACIGKYSC